MTTALHADLVALTDHAAEFRAAAHNRRVRDTLVAARDGRGYVACREADSVVHAARTDGRVDRHGQLTVGVVTGNSDRLHPRPLCRRTTTPDDYATLTPDPLTDDVTCPTCLARLARLARKHTTQRAINPAGSRDAKARTAGSTPAAATARTTNPKEAPVATSTTTIPKVERELLDRNATLREQFAAAYAAVETTDGAFETSGGVASPTKVGQKLIAKRDRIAGQLEANADKLRKRGYTVDPYDSQPTKPDPDPTSDDDTPAEPEPKAAAKKNGKPTAGRKRASKGTCSKRGCSDDVHAKGLCPVHYREARKAAAKEAK